MHRVQHMLNDEMITEGADFCFDEKWYKHFN